MVLQRVQGETEDETVQQPIMNIQNSTPHKCMWDETVYGLGWWRMV